MSAAPPKRQLPQAALFLSLAFPGAGQFYLGARGRGVAWALGVLVPLSFCVYYCAMALSLLLRDYTTLQFDTMESLAPEMMRLSLLAILWALGFVTVHGACAWDAWRMGARADRAEPQPSETPAEG